MGSPSLESSLQGSLEGSLGSSLEVMELLAQDILEQDIIEKIGGCGAELNREIVSRCAVCL